MKKLLLWVFGALGLALAAAACWAGVLAAEGYGLYRAAMAEESLADRVASVRARADYTPFEEIPETFRNAVVAVEDRTFYAHCGINPIAILRAVLANAKADDIVAGGSTITQQLAKNLCFTMKQTLTRKAAEVFVTLRLEQELSKDEILTLYLNVIYYGDNYYGVGAAARGYFGCAPAAMTDDACTLLAGLPNAPSAYALSHHADLARQRQKTVLRQMVRCGYLTQAQADALSAEADANAAAQATDTPAA